MFSFKSFKEIPLSAAEYIMKKYGNICINCNHTKQQHIDRYVDRKAFVKIADYQGCDYCSCSQFKILSPIELALLIEEELERRESL